MDKSMEELVNKAKEMGIPKNLELTSYIIKLENKIKELEENFDSRIENLAMHHERHIDRHERKRY